LSLAHRSQELFRQFSCHFSIPHYSLLRHKEYRALRKAGITLTAGQASRSPQRKLLVPCALVDEIAIRFFRFSTRDLALSDPPGCLSRQNTYRTVDSIEVTYFIPEPSLPFIIGNWLSFRHEIFTISEEPIRSKSPTLMMLGPTTACHF